MHASRPLRTSAGSSSSLPATVKGKPRPHSARRHAPSATGRRSALSSLLKVSGLTASVICLSLTALSSVMATGFTWDTQNRETDTAACLAVWEHAKRMLADPSLNMVLLDEITYMVAYDYLPLEEVLNALKTVPPIRRSSSRGAGVIGIFWSWQIPSASCVRLNMRLMRASKRK